MPSDRKKKAAATKGKKVQAKGEDGGLDADADAGPETPLLSANASTANLEALTAATRAVKEVSVSDAGRSCTGVLASHPQ
ncbi:hypothetical protein TSOC_011554, partial [Tetrabaena socialis]